MHRAVLNPVWFVGSNVLCTYRKAFIILPEAIYPFKAAAHQNWGYILYFSFKFDSAFTWIKSASHIFKVFVPLTSHYYNKMEKTPDICFKIELELGTKKSMDCLKSASSSHLRFCNMWYLCNSFKLENRTYYQSISMWFICYASGEPSFDSLYKPSQWSFNH